MERRTRAGEAAGRSASIRGRWAWWVAGLGLAVLLAVPPFLATYYVYILNVVYLYVILAVGYNILVGFAGQFAMSHVGFFGVGVYTYGVLNITAPSLFPLWILAGGALAAAVGVCVALPAIRMRDIYLALVTFSFAEVLRWIFLNWDSVTGGSNGLRIPPGQLGRWQLTTDVQVYYLILVVMLLSVYAAWNLVRSRFGRAFSSIKNSEPAAQAFGINLVWYKTLAFGVSAFYAGIAGGLYGVLVGYIHPESLQFLHTVIYLAMVVVGGIGTLAGPVIGACLLGLLPEVLRGFTLLQEVLFGLLLMGFIVFMPLGIYGTARATYERHRRVAEQAGEAEG